MQEAILRSSFLGRDGFRWWIGQVAPSDAQGSQANGGGWGNRCKVRIMGYHPFDDTELPNNDLPWAQCLLPTTAGTGAAQSAENTKLKPGDVVFGFYLDSDNAQAPVILGAFGRTEQVLTEHYSSPFVPFTGSTDRIKKPNGKLAPNESNQQNATSAKSPRSVDSSTASRLNAAGGQEQNSPNVEISYSSAIGQTTVFANTCKDNSINTISSTIGNLLTDFQAAGNVAANIENNIRRAISKVTSVSSGMVGQMFNYLYTELIGILQQGLKLLYETVFAQVLAATRDPIAAHAAGVAAQTAMINPVKILKEAIPCVAASILNGLEGVISDLIRSLLGQVQNLAECAINQFSGAILNNIISSVESGLSGPIGGVSKILSAGFSITNVLLGAVGAIEGLAGLFDCNQSSKTKCSSLTTKWKNGTGGDTQTTDFATILNDMNVAAALGSLVNYKNFDIFNSSTQNPNAPLSPLGGCYTGPPTHCNTPTISIYGGQGSGAEATAIMGSFVEYATGSTTNTINRTASIIGATINNGGSGYVFPPHVVFRDNCNQGYGAVGQGIINDAGQVTGIVMISSGEFYPVDVPTNVPPYTVNSVVVANPGSGYKTGDTAKDNIGIGYTLTISKGQIIAAKPINNVIVTDLPTITIDSKTGVGAILRPIVGVASSPFPGTTGQPIDVNQCYTK